MELNYELEQHMKGDGDYKIALSTLLSLSSRIYDLFESSKSDEKRRLISFVFSNLEIYGEELRFSLRKPFDLFVNLGECKEWLERLDKIRTEYRSEVLLLREIIPFQMKAIGFSCAI